MILKKRAKKNEEYLIPILRSFKNVNLYNCIMYSNI